MMSPKNMEHVEEFNKELMSINGIKPPVSKAKITTIVKLALKATHYYKYVVQSVEKFIWKCKVQHKLPGLYVIDAIIHQARLQFKYKDVYAPRFARNLYRTFNYVFQCPDEDRKKVMRVLNLWSLNDIFKDDVLKPIFELAEKIERKKEEDAEQEQQEEVKSEQEGSDVELQEETKKMDVITTTETGEEVVSKDLLLQLASLQSTLQNQNVSELLNTLKDESNSSSLSKGIEFLLSNPNLIKQLGELQNKFSLTEIKSLEQIVETSLGGKKTAVAGSPELNNASLLAEESEFEKFLRENERSTHKTDLRPNDLDLRSITLPRKPASPCDPHHSITKQFNLDDINLPSNLNEINLPPPAGSMPPLPDAPPLPSGRGSDLTADLPMNLPRFTGPPPPSQQPIHFNIAPPASNMSAARNPLSEFPNFSVPPPSMTKPPWMSEPPPPLPPSEQDRDQDVDMEISQEEDPSVTQRSRSRSGSRGSRRRRKTSRHRSRSRSRGRRSSKSRKRKKDRSRSRGERKRSRERRRRSRSRSRARGDKKRSSRSRDRKSRKARSRSRDRDARRRSPSPLLLLERGRSAFDRDDKQDRGERRSPLGMRASPPAGRRSPLSRDRSETRFGGGGGGRDTRSRDKSETDEKDEERKKKGFPPARKDHISICTKTLWVGHLPKTISEEELRDMFTEYGAINSLNLIPPRGCAFVNMSERLNAANALKGLKNTRIAGKYIQIDWAPGKYCKDGEYKKFWNVDHGVTYLPYNEIENTNYESLIEGCVFDFDTVPEFLKSRLEMVQMSHEAQQMGQPPSMGMGQGGHPTMGQFPPMGGPPGGGYFPPAFPPGFPPMMPPPGIRLPPPVAGAPAGMGPSVPPMGPSVPLMPPNGPRFMPPPNMLPPQGGALPPGGANNFPPPRPRGGFPPHVENGGNRDRAPIRFNIGRPGDRGGGGGGLYDDDDNVAVKTGGYNSDDNMGRGSGED